MGRMLTLALAVLLTCGGASATVLLQDGDFTDNGGSSEMTFVAGTTPFGHWIMKAPAFDVAPSGGNTGAWMQQSYNSDVRAMVGVAPPTPGSKLTVSFDWIEQASMYGDAFSIRGLMAGDTQTRGAGSPLVGTVLYSAAQLGAASNWTRKSFEVTVNSNYAAILLLWQVGSDSSAALKRGFDNVLVTSVLPLHPGDANGDGMVDVGDLGILGFNYGKATGATWGMADFTGDGAVDVGDLGILGFHYGFGVPAGAVPEPATMSLLALGIAGLMRRRR